MKREQIKVGKWTVDAALLRGITLDEAFKLFPTKNKKRIETAWKMANPEREKKTAPGGRGSSTTQE